MKRSDLLGTVLSALATCSLVLGASAQAQDFSLERDGDDDAFYCQERKLGQWFYCSKPKPKEELAETGNPVVPAGMTAVQRMKLISDELAELKARAVLEPSPENVTQYIQFQREQLDRASMFSDVWQRQIWQNANLDYTLQRPVSTLGKRAWLDGRKADRDIVMSQLAQRYGVFYFYSSSCGACEIASPIIKALGDKYGLNVLAVSMDGGPNSTFRNYAVNTGQYEKMGLQGGQVPALVLFDSVTKQPMPIGYGILAQDEIMERIFQLTQVAPGGDL